MKRTRGLIVLTSLAVLTLNVVSMAAQQPQKTTASYRKSPARVTRQPKPATVSRKIRTYAPRIKSHSSSTVIEGLVTGLEGNVITIKTARASRRDFGLDEQTTVLASGELFSISTMADIALSVADLHISDRVEIVTERVGRKEVARIITRIASSGAQVAKR